MNPINPTAMATAERDRSRRRVLAVCCLSLVLVVLAVTSVNIAIPALQRGLDASATELLWIVDVYALVFAATLLPAGALGDRLGRKGALVVGLALFGAGALLAGLSTSTPQVIGARAVMGVGAGFVMPATLSIITTVFPPTERAKAIAVWAGFAGAGGALGPVLSGLVLELWSWNAVFFITVPVVAIDVALVALLVPRSSEPAHTRLDPVGAALSVLGLFSLLFAIIEGPQRGWTAASVVGAFVAAALLLAAFVGWELLSSHPMLDPRFFRIPAFSAGAATITVIFFVMFGMFFLITQFLQFVQGHSPLGAAVRMLPSGLTMIVVAPRGPALAARVGPHRSTALGLFGAAVGFAVLSQLGPDTAYAWVAAALVLMAAGTALAMPPATAAIVGSLPAAKAGVGSAVNDVTREVGGAVGIAVLGSVVSVLYRTDITDAAARLPDGPRQAFEESIGSAVAASSTEPASFALDAARQAFAAATHTVFLIAAALMATGALVYLWLHSAGRRRAPASTQSDAEPTEALRHAAASNATVPCAR